MSEKPSERQIARSSIKRSEIGKGIQAIGFSGFPHRTTLTTKYEAALCSIGGKPFQGEVEISYIAGNQIIEFISFEAWLKEIVRDPTTVEELADLIYTALFLVLDSENGLQVKVRASTECHGDVTIQIGGLE